MTELDIGSLLGHVELEDDVSDPAYRAISSMDALSESFRRAGFGIVEVGRAMESAGRVMTAAVTVPLVAAGAASLKFASDYEAGLTKSITLTDAGRKEIESLSGAILNLAMTTGRAPEALTQALFPIESAGYRGAVAMDVLTKSAKMAALGMGTEEENARALISAMLSYQKEGLTAAQASDQFVETIRLGNMKVNELIPSLGRLIPIASRFGVSFAQMNAAIATFTHLGVPVEVATTGVRAVLTSIINDAPKTEKGLQAIALASGDVTINMESLRQEILTKGLDQALIHLVRTASTVPQGLDKLHDVFGNIRAFTTVLADAAGQTENYQHIASRILDSTGVLEQAFAEQGNTFKQQWDLFVRAAQVVAIELGRTLLPIMKDLIGFLREHVIPAVREMIHWWGELPGPVRTAGVAFATVAIAAGPFLLFAGEIVLTIGHITRAIGALQEAGGLAGLSTMLRSTAGSMGVFTAAAALIAPGMANINAAVTGVAGILGRLGTIASASITGLGGVFAQIGGIILEPLRIVFLRMSVIVENAFGGIAEIAMTRLSSMGGAIGSIFGSIGATISSMLAPVTGAISGVYAAVGGLVGILSTLAVGLTVVGTAWASWKFGEWIGEITGATDAVTRFIARLEGVPDAITNATIAAHHANESFEEFKKHFNERTQIGTTDFENAARLARQMQASGELAPRLVGGGVAELPPAFFQLAESFKAAQAAGRTLPADLQKIVDIAEAAKKPVVDLGSSIDLMAGKTLTQAEKIKNYLASLSQHGLGNLSKDAVSLATQAFEHHKNLSQVTADLKEMGLVSDADEPALKALEQRFEEGTRKAKSFSDAWVELNSLQGNAIETTQAINPALVSEIQALQDAGARTEVLSKAYPQLTKAQIEAINITRQLDDVTVGLGTSEQAVIEWAMREGLNLGTVARAYGINERAATAYAAALTRIREIENTAHPPTFTALPLSATDIEAGAMLKEYGIYFDRRTALEKQLAQMTAVSAEDRIKIIEAEVAEELRQLGEPPEKMEAEWTILTNLIKAKGKEQVDAITLDMNEIRTKNTDALMDMYYRAQNTYDFMELHSDQFSKKARQDAYAVATGYYEAAHGIVNAWSQALSSLSQMFQGMGQVVGGVHGQFLQQLGTLVVTADTWHKTFKELSSGNVGTTFGVGSILFDEHATKEQKWAAGVQAAVAVASGAVAVWQATASASKVQNIFGGAMAGAQAGMAFGAPGAAIGAVLGGLVGLFRGKPEWARAADEVGRDMGLHISDQLAQQIADDAHKIFHGLRQEATTFNLAKIIEESGGLNAQNFDMFAHKLRDVFSFVQTGTMTAAQAAKVLDQNFQDFVKNGTNGLGFLNDQMRELIKLDQQYGTHSAAIADYTKQQLSDVATGLNAVAAGTIGLYNNAFETLGSYDSDMQELTDKADKLQAQINDRLKKGITSDTQRVQLQIWQHQLDDVNKQIADLAKKGDTAAATIAHLGETGQTEFDRLGRLTTTTFAADISSGKTFTDTLKEIGPTLDILSKAQANFGFTSSGTLNDLLAFKKFADLNPELVGTLDGLNKMMTGLSNTTKLTQPDFTDLASIATETFDKLTAGGLTSDQAMLAMQPTLEKIWYLQDKFGYAVDDATQALLDQAKAEGYVGSQFEDPQQQMIDGLSTIADILKIIAHQLGADIPEAAKNGAGEAQKYLDGLHSPKVTVDVAYNDPGFVPNQQESYAATGGLVTSEGIMPPVYAAVGAKILPFQPKGTDVIPAMLTPNERVLSVQENAAYEKLMAVASNIAIQRTGTDNQPAVIHNYYVENNINAIDTKSFEEKIAEEGLPTIVTKIEDGYRNFNTRLRRALDQTK